MVECFCMIISENNLNFYMIVVVELFEDYDVVIVVVVVIKMVIKELDNMFVCLMDEVLMVSKCYKN